MTPRSQVEEKEAERSPACPQACPRPPAKRCPHDRGPWAFSVCPLRPAAGRGPAWRGFSPRPWQSPGSHAHACLGPPVQNGELRLSSYFHQAGAPRPSHTTSADTSSPWDRAEATQQLAVGVRATGRRSRAPPQVCLSPRASSMTVHMSSEPVTPASLASNVTFCPPELASWGQKAIVTTSETR